MLKGLGKQISRKSSSSRLWWLVIYIVLLFLGAAGAIADVDYPVGNSLFNLDYDRAWQSAVATGDLRNVPPIGPYSFSRLSHLLEGQSASPTMGFLGSVEESRVRVFSLLQESFQFEKRAHGKDIFSFSGGARYQPSKHFGATVLFGLDRAKATDPDYTGIKWRGLAGDLETAAIYFRKGGLSLTLGRQRVFWGPQPVNLLLSATAEPLDQFSASFRKGRLQFSFLFARLDKSRPDATDSSRFSSFNDNRYLAGHRIDIALHKRLRIGLFETTLYGGEGRAPELYYLNPLQFFHSVQLNEQMDDNTIVGMDLTYFPINGLAAYGQVMIDDFQIDDRAVGDQEPNEIGLMFGIFNAGSIGSLSPDLKLEYVRVTNRTYHQRRPRNRYLFRNELLGHPLGPDADSASFAAGFWPSDRQNLVFEVAYCRHGEGSIYAPWDEPWKDYDGDYSEPFPTGVVQRAFHVAIRGRGYLPIGGFLRDHLYLSLEAGYANCKNRHNLAGANDTSGWVSIALTWLGAVELGVGD